MTAGQAMSVLLVEDDERLSTFTAGYLADRGVSVTPVRDGASALRALRAGAFDAVVLDVMLPDKDGFAVCRAIRASSDVPVLLVTARTDEADRVLGLELGADDYVVKPFSPRELLARLTAFVRRHRGELAPRPPELQVGPLRLDPASFRAFLHETPLALAPAEFALLTRLMERPGRVLTRDQLLELLKGNSDEVFDRSIDVLVSRVRQKLAAADDDARELIRTIRGVGYMLVAGAR